MAELDYVNEQVSLNDDWYYDRSGTVDISNERGNELCYTSGVDHHQDIPCESIGVKAEGISSFDAVIEELDLDIHRGNAELEDHVEDEISPAIQISKTFSLASFGTHSQCNEQPSPPQSDKSQQESYKLTNLDNEIERNGDKNTISLQSDGELLKVYKEEHVNQDSVNSFSSTYKRKRTKKRIGCHVIDLETFSTSRSSSITMEYNDIGSQAPCPSADQNLEHSPVNSSITKGKLSTSTRHTFFGDHSYGIDAMHPDGEQSKPCPFNRQTVYFGDESKFPCSDVNFSDTNYGNVGISSFYLPDDSGECPTYTYSLEPMTANSIESEETSDMVIDLNERLPVDSGIFDVSLTRPSTASSSQGYLRQTNYPSQTRETFIPECTISGGNFKDKVSFFHDRQVASSPQMCQKKPNLATYEIPYHVSREASYYDEMMKTLREPFVTDECGYMYQQEHNSSFLCNRVMPCPGWESIPTHKNSCTPMITDLVEESGQGMWCSSDSFTNLFESREPSDIAQYTHPANIKDEEETDDADEIGFLPETADISCSYLSHGQDRSNSYLVTESPHMARFTAATLTPPPSESSTPNPPSNHGYNDDMSMYQWAPFTSSCSLSECISNETITSLSPLQQSRLQPSYNHVTPDYLDINLLSYGSQRGIARPFPSMADAIQSGHTSPSTYPYNETAIRKSDPNTKRRGKSRKIQIQSHKISTSTPKDSKSFRDKPELASPGNSVALHGINKYGKIKPQTKGIKSSESDNKAPRHNEPLKQHAVDVMTRWYEANIHNPYPTKAQKTAMAQEGQISENQVHAYYIDDI